MVTARATTTPDGGFPWGPAIVPALRALPAAEAILVELGLATDAARLLEPARPCLQVLLPRHRVDLPAARAERTAELRREWPGDAARLDAGLRPCAPPSTRSSRSSPRSRRSPRAASANACGFTVPGSSRRPPAGTGAGPLADLGDHPLAVALRGAWPFLGLPGRPALRRWGWPATLGGALQGTLRPAGGEAAIAALLRRRIAESRGELLGGDGEPAPVSGLELEGGKATYTEGEGRRGPLRGQGLRLRRGRLRPADAHREARSGWNAGSSPPPRRAGSSPWPGSCGATRCPRPSAIWRWRIGPDGTAVLLQALPALRAGPKGPEASPTERVLVAATPVRGAGETTAEVIRPPSPDRRRAPALPRPRHRPRVRPGHPARGARLPSPLRRPTRSGARGRRGHHVSPIGNLFLAGREVLPGLGAEGQFHAAWQAAAAVERHLGAKNRPK